LETLAAAEAGLDRLRTEYRLAVEAATPIFQSGGRWSHLLTLGQSITADGPVALSRHAEALEARVAALEAGLWTLVDGWRLRDCSRTLGHLGMDDAVAEARALLAGPAREET
jgi:hypothetical protein